MNRNFSIENEELVLTKAWPQHQKLELCVGNWRELFSEQETKVIIAVALNYCAHYEELKIIGYLITAKKVSLVVAGGKERLDKTIAVFYEQTTLGIVEMLKQNKYECEELSDLAIEQSMKQLDEWYKVCRFTNQYLVKLITGQKIELPYYNLEVEKLKKQILAYDFCSAIDYAGAKGPVLITTKWK